MILHLFSLLSFNASQEEIAKLVDQDKYLQNPLAEEQKIREGENEYQYYSKQWQLKQAKNNQEQAECLPEKRPEQLEVFLNKEQREKNGGEACQCSPLSKDCLPGSCLCLELCPHDSSILAGRPELLKQTHENTFSFTNSHTHNDLIYKNHPLKEGYCSGHAMLEKKFQSLSFFSLSGALSTNGQRPLDPFTQQIIPVEGSEAYHQYIKKNINRIAEGKAAFFPGIENLNKLSSHPLYQTLIGDLVATQWGHYSQLESHLLKKKMGKEKYNNSQSQEMTPSQYKSLLQEILSKVSEYNPLSEMEMNDPIALFRPHSALKKSDSKKLWYKKGPWEKVNLNYWYQNSKKIATSTNTEKERGAHGLTVWGYQKNEKTGQITLCLRDPNDLGFANNSCQARMDFIPVKDGYKVLPRGYAPIYGVYIPPYQEGEQGLMIRELIQACQAMNKGKFFNDNCPKN